MSKSNPEPIIPESAAEEPLVAHLAVNMKAVKAYREALTEQKLAGNQLRQAEQQAYDAKGRMQRADAEMVKSALALSEAVNQALAAK